MTHRTYHLADGSLDVAAIRQDFPILSRTVRDERPLVYLDSAATSQKPTQVWEAEQQFYAHVNAAVHRGAHALSEEATDAYESARQRIAAFMGAQPEDLIFVKNATEGLNLVSYAFSNATALAAHGNCPDAALPFVLQPGDEILVTEMEHHANLVPWQELAAKTGATLRWIGLTDHGRLDLHNLDELINERTKIVAFVHQSNILGTINPVEPLVRAAKRVAAFTVLDACQSVPHFPVDVATLGVDAVALSAHKMLGPTGIGGLWLNPKLANDLPPFITGGSMIEKVTMKHTTFTRSPQRFEAGTPMVAQAVSWAAAVDYLTILGMEQVHQHELALTSYALEQLAHVPDVRILGPEAGPERGGLISFTMGDLHPHDVGQVLDDAGIAVRVGHHCAWPVCRRYEVPATTRASFYVYNTMAEVDAFIEGMHRVGEFFGGR